MANVLAKNDVVPHLRRELSNASGIPESNIRDSSKNYQPRQDPNHDLGLTRNPDPVPARAGNVGRRLLGSKIWNTIQPTFEDGGETFGALVNNVLNWLNLIGTAATFNAVRRAIAPDLNMSPGSIVANDEPPNWGDSNTVFPSFIDRLATEITNGLLNTTTVSSVSGVVRTKIRNAGTVGKIRDVVAEGIVKDALTRERNSSRSARAKTAVDPESATKPEASLLLVAVVVLLGLGALIYLLKSKGSQGDAS